MADKEKVNAALGTTTDTTSTTGSTTNTTGSTTDTTAQNSVTAEKTNNTLTQESPSDSVVKVKDTGITYTPITTTTTSYTDIQKQLMDLDNAAATTKSIVSQVAATVPDVETDTINHVDTTYQKQLIDQLNQAQKDQVNNSVDYAVNTGVTELQRALADAQDTYNTQYSQIAADEQRALDNQALYNKARGDNGGIGAAQYGAIQNTAAVNRQTVKNEQTKLATDTSRQIADLRSQGEFERADKLLSITQNYLSQLLDREQYAQQMNLSIDEFNAQLGEWEAEYRLQVSQYLTNTELSTAQLTGAFSSGTPTLSNLQQMNQTLANLGWEMIKAGIKPTDEQLKAMGFTEEQYQQYYNYLHPASSGGGGGGYYYSGDGSGSGTKTTDHIIDSVADVLGYTGEKPSVTSDASKLYGAPSR